jgi:hypothetical protein
MTDKTEEMLAKEKAAVDAMRNAQANMSNAIKRIETLERAFISFISNAEVALKHIPESGYLYRSETTCRDSFKTDIAKAKSFL